MSGFKNNIALATNIQTDADRTGSGSFDANGQILIGGVADPKMAVAVPTASNGVSLSLGQNTLEVLGIDATTSQVGVVTLASDAEAIAGTNSDKPVVPTALKAKLGSQTANALTYGGGDDQPLNWLSEATNGQIPIGSTGNPPVLGAITGSNGIDVTLGAGTIEVAGAGAGPTPGVIAIASDAETIAGVVDDKAVVPSGLKAKLGVQTLNGIPYGGGDDQVINWLGAATNGQLPIGSTGNAPVLAAPTGSNGVAIATGAGSLEVSGINATTTQVGVVTLATDAETIAGTVTDKAVVPTSLKAKLGSQTANSLMYGGGDNQALNWLGAATNGQLPIGSTGAAPVLAAPTGGNGVAVSLGAGSIGIDGINATTSQIGVVTLASDAEAIAGTDTVKAIVPSSLGAKLGSQTANGIPYGAGTTQAVAWTGALTDGQLVIGSTGNPPAASTLTAGTGVSITNGAGSITVSASVEPISWVVTSSATNMDANRGYVLTGADNRDFLLPASSAVGDLLWLVGNGTGLWTITQAAGQNVRFGTAITTTGAGGSVASTLQGDSAKLVCVVANTSWQIISGTAGALVLT